MSSKTAADTKDGGWSLTHRVARTIAATSIAAVTLYALISVVFLFGMMRQDLKNLLEHEVQELDLAIDIHGRDVMGVTLACETIAEVIDEPAVAFRVRRDGELIAEAGDQRVIEKLSIPITSDTSWREHLFSNGIAVGAFDRRDGFHIEVLVDAHDHFAHLVKFLEYSAVAFLIITTISVIVGWLLARRAMASLRSVADQSTRIDPVTNRARIDLDGAPHEIEALGVSLNSMLERIEESSTHLRTFSAFLAHELRSPLQNLIGETEVTLLSYREPEEYQQLLRSNLDDLHDLSDAIANLVAYCGSRTPSDSEQLNFEEFDLLREAELRLGRERRTAHRRGIALTVRARGDATLRADREACLRTLRNLVGNALEACGSGDSVDVEIRGDADSVDIIVTDTGPGVSDEIVDQIFEPFVTARVRDDRRGGYGLGLAISRAVMREHEGTLRFENAPGGGARFTASFPRRTRGSRPPASLPSATRSV